MGTKNHPSTFDCYAHAEPDEPLFVLLARDVHAPFLVRAWADIREAQGEAPRKIEEARACADAMERWNQKSRGRKPLATQAVFDLFKVGPMAGAILAEYDQSGLGDLGEMGGLEGLPADPFAVFPDLRAAIDEGADSPPRPAADSATPDSAALAAPGVPSGGSVLGKVAVAQIAVPRALQGPPSAGPSSAGPPTAGPPTAGPPTAGPPTAGPPTAGPTAGPPTAGPPTAGLPTAGLPTAGPPAVPPAPKPVGPPARTVKMTQSLTMGLGCEFEIRATPQFLFALRTATTNAPGLGFVQLLDWKMGNVSVLYDKAVGDFTKPDVYAYCAKGPGKTGIDAPVTTTNHGIRILARYTGQVPDGFGFADSFEFELTLHGDGPAGGRQGGRG